MKLYVSLISSLTPDVISYTTPTPSTVHNPIRLHALIYINYTMSTLFAFSRLSPSETKSSGLGSHPCSCICSIILAIFTVINPRMMSPLKAHPQGIEHPCHTSNMLSVILTSERLFDVDLRNRAERSRIRNIATHGCFVCELLGMHYWQIPFAAREKGVEWRIVQAFMMLEGTDEAPPHR